VAAGLVLTVVLLLWYGVFPWLEPKMQFDHGVVDSPTPGSPSSGPPLPGEG
jgi:hypothetical protein